MTITSIQNDRIKQVRLLQSKRSARRKHSLFVIEGPTLISEAVSLKLPLDSAYYTPSFVGDGGLPLIEQVGATGIPLIPVDDKVMEAMSDTQHPQGILAVLPFLDLPVPENPDFVLIIDSISDPGNMGTIMRAAAAAGVPLMIVTAGTVDLTNPKVVRAGMGAGFRLPVKQVSWEAIARELADHVILLADVGRGTPYYQVNWRPPTALIVSEEAQGPSEQARQIAHVPVTIPMPGGMESLNVGVAASILIFEMTRQRALGG
jgi:TrmH family RNA methyltransferase